MNIIKKTAANKTVCIVFWAAALVYGIVLPFCWGNDPWDVHGTLSLLCENHIPFFWIWVVLTGGCFLFNNEHMYMKFGGKSRLPEIFLLLSIVGMVLTAATLNHSIADWNPKRTVHWIGAIICIACTALSFLAYFLLNLKFRGFKVLAGITAALVVELAVWFFAFGRSGYMEMVPTAAFEIILFVVNFTSVIKAPEKEPQEQTAE